MYNLFRTAFIFTVLIVLPFSAQAQIQVREPEVVDVVTTRDLFDEGYRFGIGFNIFVNDMGFGVGAQFRKGIQRYTELILNLRIGGLRDPAEQTFVGFFGEQTIPNKFNRAIVFPALIGVKHRLFPDRVNDSFRVFASVGVGPILAFVYPYFDDLNNNGFRENIPNFARERINGFFSGFSDGFTEWGYNGEFTLGIDFGSNFARITSLQFGYAFYNFPGGIQLMEPFRPDLTPSGQLQIDSNGDLILEPFNDKRKFFGSAVITFTLGGMW